MGTRVRTAALAGLVVLGAGLGGIWWSQSRMGRGPSDVVILEKVQAIGELRTARHTYQRVFEYETALQPAAWVEAIPPAASLVRSSTRNRALVSARASVDAGVDLRRAEVAREVREGKPTLVVRLPEPEVYRPVVEAKVFDAKSGLFWRDDNLGLKASAEVGETVRAAAHRAGIASQAKQNAREQLVELLEPIARQPVVVEFGIEPSGNVR